MLLVSLRDTLAKAIEFQVPKGKGIGMLDGAGVSNPVHNRGIHRWGAMY